MDWFVQSQIKLEPNEQFKKAWRQSALVLVWKLLGPLLLAILLVVLYFVVTSLEGLVERVTVGLIVSFALAVLIWISVLIVLWWIHIYVLTSRRLIHRKGIIVRSRVEIQLPKVQNASYAAEMVQKWVGLGTVKVETASVGPAFVTKNVRGALAISQLVLVIAEQAKQEIALMDEKQVRRLLGVRISQGA